MDDSPAHNFIYDGARGIQDGTVCAYDRSYEYDGSPRVLNVNRGTPTVDYDCDSDSMTARGRMTSPNIVCAASCQGSANGMSVWSYAALNPARHAAPHVTATTSPPNAPPECCSSPSTPKKRDGELHE